MTWGSKLMLLFWIGWFALAVNVVMLGDLSAGGKEKNGQWVQGYSWVTRHAVFLTIMFGTSLYLFLPRWKKMDWRKLVSPMQRNSKPRLPNRGDQMTYIDHPFDRDHPLR